MNKTLRYSLLLSVLLGSSSGIAYAQKAATGARLDTPSVTTASYGNWVLRCVQLDEATAGKNAGQKTCEIVQTIQQQNQQQPLAQIAIGHLPGDSTLVLTAVLPTNISIPGSVRLSGNGKTGAEEKGGFDLAWRRCVPGGCFADAKADRKILAALDPETDGQLLFTDAAGRPLAIPVSWQGLQAALKALEGT